MRYSLRWFYYDLVPCKAHPPNKTIDKICKSRNRLYKVISKESKSHNYPDHISNDY